MPCFTRMGVVAGLMLLTGTLAGAQEVGSGDGVLARAKALYATASYEEALKVLAEVPLDANLDEVDQYRALCFLALRNDREVARVLERIVSRSPAFQLNAADESPRLVTAYQSARKRVLPAVARDMYAAAKGQFDRQDHELAVAAFTKLLGLLAENDLSGTSDGLTDLKALAEGFLSLSRAQLAARSARTVVLAAPVQVAALPPRPRREPPFYSVRDREVVPPEAVDRTLPMWDPPSQSMRQLEHRGLLDLLIDEQGYVEKAAILDSVTPAYDQVLLKAAQDWRYRPAIWNGKPVKYRTVMSIVLKPGDSR